MRFDALRSAPAAIAFCIAALVACDREETPSTPPNVVVPTPTPATTPAWPAWPGAPAPTPITTVAPASDGPYSDPEHRSAIHATLDRIAHGGPYPYRQDGVVFENREHRLPDAAFGYYHEFTVPTPGVPTRGARRIVRGDHGETWYSDDHYRSFVVIDPVRY